MERDSMVFYKNWLSVISDLPDKEQLRVLIAILSYGLHGEVGEMKSSIAKAILSIVKYQIDVNNQKYIKGCKGAEYGKLGGRPKKKRDQKENPE